MERDHSPSSQADLNVIAAARSYYVTLMRYRTQTNPCLSTAAPPDLVHLLDKVNDAEWDLLRAVERLCPDLALAQRAHVRDLASHRQ